MSTSAKMILVLAVITALAGAILSAWDGYTQPKIEQHRLEALQAAIADVLPAHDHYDEVQADDMTLYVGKNSANQPVGIAFRAVGSGFQGEIAMMVGVTPDFEQLTGLAILEQIETPGLGAKIQRDPSKPDDPNWFTQQFQGVRPNPEITVVKNQQPDQPNEIQAITGATISSRAVVQILNTSLERAKQVYRTSKQQVS